MGWLDDIDGAEDELLKEFEKLLTETPGKSKFDELPDAPKEKMKKLSKFCSHEWIKAGSSPISGIQWWNCKYCDIAKEEYEKSKN